MARLTLPATALLGLFFSHLASAELRSCGNAQYDPTQYVCWDNNFLCPILSGEPLSACASACYSKFMYTCNNNVLNLLPAVGAQTPFTLTASNPNLPINGAPVTASGQTWYIGGTTSSFCPDVVGPACPPGNITAIVASGGSASMDVEVPGGQQAYLGPFWNMGYTQAHSASIPSGSLTTVFGAYQGGGFVNLASGALGWVACPPTASGGGNNGGRWNLVGKNATNAANLGNCYGVNLKVNTLPQGTIGAWQYT